MKRIAMMILRNIFFVIYAWIRLTWYVRHEDRYTEEQKYAFFKTICRRAVKSGNITIEPHGVENIPEQNGFIMYPNHQGMFDVLAIMEVCPKPFSVVAKKEVENIPILRKIFRLMKAQMIDREDLRQSMQVILNVTKEVKEGRNYVIFAEGTRSREGNKTLDFKGGSFKAATRAKCPIVPVALVNSYQAFDTGSTGKITVQVHFLDPLPYEEYQGRTTVEIAEEVRRRIDAVLEETAGIVSKE